MEIPLDSLSQADAAVVLLMAPPATATEAPAVAPGKNIKPAPRRYPLQPAGHFAPAPPGRNVPCPCGSGAKFKRCHGA